MKTALYRRYIREVLRLSAPYPMTEQQIRDAVDGLLPGPCDLSELRSGMEWNLAKDYIRASENEDTDEEEWRLTDLGAAKAAQD